MRLGYVRALCFDHGDDLVVEHRGVICRKFLLVLY